MKLFSMNPIHRQILLFLINFNERKTICMKKEFEGMGLGELMNLMWLFYVNGTERGKLWYRFLAAILWVE